MLQSRSSKAMSSRSGSKFVNRCSQHKTSQVFVCLLQSCKATAATISITSREDAA